MAEGVRKSGDAVQICSSDGFRAPCSDVAVFYGFDGSLQRVFRAYREAGRPAVYVDLGYWGRVEGGKFAGYHKVSVNGRHPTAYFQSRRHDDRRFSKFRLTIEGWRAGRSILLAGTSEKGALVDGFKAEEWERQAIALLRQHTDRPIIYRPKPSWTGARPIEGAVFAHSMEDVALALNDCHAVVTHHSNVAVDGLIRGIPAFCIDGVATPLALSDLSLVESPKREGDRHRWACDIAYCQFTVEEMRAGVVWRHLKSEELIP